VGQKRIVDELRRQLAGALALKEPFPPTLFQGSSGVGKTLLAQSLTREIGSQIIVTRGDVSVDELAKKITRLDVMDLLFVDESHNLSFACQELLYEVIDEGRLPRRAGDAPDGRSDGDASHQRVAPCTIILATDQPGRLLNALYKRMELVVALGFYEPHELKEIVDRLASNLGLLISPQASRIIAEVSGGLPRKAKHFLRNLRRHAPGGLTEQITAHDVRRFLADVEVDTKGLARQERSYLAYLAEAHVASLESLALFLGVDPTFVRRQIEPLLLRQRLIEISRQGRQLTPAGRRWLAASIADNAQEVQDAQLARG
jgi:Holliday junction DNA helicase RuvB